MRKFPLTMSGCRAPPLSSQANWVNAGRPYPWTVQDSGFRALTAYVLTSGTPDVP